MTVNFKYNNIMAYTGWIGSHTGSLGALPIDEATLKEYLNRTANWLSTLSANIRSDKIWRPGSSASAYLVAIPEPEEPTELRLQYCKRYDAGAITTTKFSSSTSNQFIRQNRDISLDSLHRLKQRTSDAASSLAKHEQFELVTLEDLVETGNIKITGNVGRYGYWYVTDATVCCSCERLLVTEEERDYHHVFNHDCVGAANFRAKLRDNEITWVSFTQLISDFELDRYEQEFLLANIRLKWTQGCDPMLPSWVESMLQQKEDVGFDLTLEQLYELYRSQSDAT